MYDAIENLLTRHGDLLAVGDLATADNLAAAMGPDRLGSLFALAAAAKAALTPVSPRPEFRARILAELAGRRPVPSAAPLVATARRTSLKYVAFLGGGALGAAVFATALWAKLRKRAHTELPAGSM